MSKQFNKEIYESNDINVYEYNVIALFSYKKISRLCFHDEILIAKLSGETLSLEML